ncbi:ATP-binding protein [Alphaproteobacteria bacterium]|nr:ATP-binding protein [Alphaproteobacteria bacterium]
MLPEVLRRKPLEEWTVEDLQLICNEECEESQYLEFKQDFSNEDKDQPLGKGGKLSKSAKAAIAKEIVALANAYGGTLVLGIEEQDSKASKLSAPFPNIAVLTNNLDQWLGTQIDPPLSNLRFKVISSDENGEGYLVYQVAQSIAAPHGYNQPPQVYIRRGEASNPMTMRDMQSMFWEARTKRERIEIEGKQKIEALANQVTSPGQLLFEFKAVSSVPLNLGFLCEDLRNGQVYKSNVIGFASEHLGMGETPYRLDLWTPEPFGAAYEISSSGFLLLYEVDDTGVIGLSGNITAPVDSTNGLMHRPDMYLELMLVFLKLCNAIDRYQKEIQISWFVTGGFYSSQSVVQIDRDRFGDVESRDFRKLKQFREVELKAFDTDENLSPLVRRLYGCFGREDPGNHGTVSNYLKSLT